MIEQELREVADQQRRPLLDTWTGLLVDTYSISAFLALFLGHRPCNMAVEAGTGDKRCVTIVLQAKLNKIVLWSETVLDMPQTLLKFKFRKQNVPNPFIPPFFHLLVSSRGHPHVFPAHR